MNISLPIILEVAIGLSFLYLILSLLASEIQESFTAFLQWRAKHLKKSIYRMLGGKLNSRELENALRTVDGSKSEGMSIYIQKLIDIPGFFSRITCLTGGKKKPLEGDEKKIADLVNEIYKTPLISSLTQSTLGFSGTDNSTSYLYGPNYIPPEIFASALIQVLARDLELNPGKYTSLSEITLEDIISNLKQQPAKKTISISSAPTSEKPQTPISSAPIPNEEKFVMPDITQYRLSAVAQKAALQKTDSKDNSKDIQLFQTEIENWFEQSQNSTGGTYKRNSKFVLFWIGFAAAILVNADTIKMFQILYSQPEVREATTQSAIDIIKKKCTDNPQSTEKCNSQLAQKEIKNLETVNQPPIGWSTDTIKNWWSLLPANPLGFFSKIIGLVISDPLRFFSKIIGLVISGFAIMMGASFWFDLLKKLVNVRNANPLLDSDSNSPNSNKN